MEVSAFRPCSAAEQALFVELLLFTKEFTSRTRVDKVNAELVTLTYGTIVAQLARDFEGDYREINKQLDKMGYNIGIRLIEDYLAKSNATRRCSNFRETAEMISRVSSTSNHPSPCMLRLMNKLGRSASRCSSTSRPRSPTGQVIVPSSHSFSTRTHWLISWSFLTMEELKTSYGTPIFFAGFSGVL